MGRAPCCDKANVKKGPWSPEEDAMLKAYIEKYGTGGNWIALPQKIGLKRCGKSCRLRWLNYLRPNIKHGGFSEEEDNIICSLYISIGSRWSIIAAQLPGRTDNDIKNYWNTRLKKKLLGRRKETQTRRLSSALNLDPKVTNGMEDNPALSNSALERLQLHMELQSLQSPFSFYNNAALWPKLHPFGGKIFPNNHVANDDPTSLMQEGATTQAGTSQKVALDELPTAPIGVQEDNLASSLSKQAKLENSLNGFSSSESSIAFSNGSVPIDTTIMSQLNSVDKSNRNLQSVSAGLYAELNELLYGKNCGYVPNEDQITEFDCFKETEGVKDSMPWWANDFDTKSSSSNSWNSASVLQPDGLFPDYVLGYDL